jgi:hypothetical protein
MYIDMRSSPAGAELKIASQSEHDPSAQDGDHSGRIEN